MRIIIFALFLAGCQTGCAQLGPTPAQLKAMEGTNSSLCVESPGWNGSPIKIHSASFGGRATGTGGGGGKATCGSSTVEFTNEGKAETVHVEKK